MLYQINKGCKSFGANDVFSNIQFEIKDKEKIAIVGRNGCGKSTLLKCILREEPLDSGIIHQMNNTTIGYLSQTALEDDSITVQEEMNKSYRRIFAIKEELEQLEEQMKGPHDDKILTKYGEILEKFERNNGYNYQSELETIFCKFGFEKEDLNRVINTFSGGQRTRIAFVKLLISKPDILLLDEPTNHLDLETIEWLEGYLKKYDKAIVIVSHDRMFLDDIVDVVYDLEYGTIKRYSGNYSSFVLQKQADIERQQQAYQRQQKEIEHLEMLIEKFRYKANKAAFAQSKIKYLDRMEKIDDAKNADTKTFKAHFKPAIKGGKTVLTVKDLVIGYDKPLGKVNLDILSKNRIAILGPNGCGKSTLVKTLVGSVPAISGSYLYGHQIETSYFDQQLAQINSDKTVLEELWDNYPDMDRTAIRSVLGQFLFSADDVFKTVNVLSGGEKVRLLLAKMLLEHGNFLILDEPTNHLDIVSKEALEEALSDFEGTILFVSHDRYFIKRIATSLLVFENGETKFYPYGYGQYVDEKNGIETVITDVKKEKVSKPRYVNPKKELEKVEKAINAKEEELSSLRELSFDPKYYHDYQKMNELEDKIDGCEIELDNLMKKWEELASL